MEMDVLDKKRCHSLNNALLLPLVVVVVVVVVDTIKRIEGAVAY